MAYDEELANRIRALLSREAGYFERKMFGGLCMMLNGNMCAGIVGADLMLRVGADAHGQMVSKPHARPMDFSGRPMTGLIYVEPAGTRDDRALARWIGYARAHVATLPPKSATPASARGRKPKRESSSAPRGR
jgi:TfoX/Sxy family transcriptional regulator of competence genes